MAEYPVCSCCNLNLATQRNSHLLSKHLVQGIKQWPVGKAGNLEYGVVKLSYGKLGEPTTLQDIEKLDYIFCPPCESRVFNDLIERPVYNKIINGSQLILDPNSLNYNQSLNYYRTKVVTQNKIYQYIFPQNWRNHFSADPNFKVYFGRHFDAHHILTSDEDILDESFCIMSLHPKGKINTLSYIWRGPGVVILQTPLFNSLFFEDVVSIPNIDVLTSIGNFRSNEEAKINEYTRETSEALYGYQIRCMSAFSKASISLEDLRKTLMASYILPYISSNAANELWQFIGNNSFIAV